EWLEGEHWNPIDVPWGSIVERLARLVLWKRAAELRTGDVGQRGSRRRPRGLLDPRKWLRQNRVLDGAHRAVSRWRRDLEAARSDRRSLRSRWLVAFGGGRCGSRYVRNGVTPPRRARWTRVARGMCANAAAFLLRVFELSTWWT